MCKHRCMQKKAMSVCNNIVCCVLQGNKIHNPHSSLKDMNGTPLSIKMLASADSHKLLNAACFSRDNLRQEMSNTLH